VLFFLVTVLFFAIPRSLHPSVTAEDSIEREGKKSEMGCRNRDSFAENHSSPSCDSLSEALLFTTMCIVGLPVDVHVKDGSVYSGIFHTTSAHADYGPLLLPLSFLSSPFTSRVFIWGAFLCLSFVSAEALTLDPEAMNCFWHQLSFC